MDKTREIKSRGEAKQFAIDYQNWASEESLSYGEIIEWSEVFINLGRIYGLTDEFQENGII